MKLINAYKKIQAVNDKIDPLPWCTLRLFGSAYNEPHFAVCGDQVCLGEDYVSIAEAREGLTWIVDQLGGKVEWGSED